MIPISTKLNLWILALPISSIASVFIVGFYFYRESFDASAFSTAVSSLLSAILVILLVWERLRDSLSKKLEYLDKNIFLSLLSKLQDDNNQVWVQDEIRKARDELKRYGRFMIIALYPSKLVEKLEVFLSSHDAFYKKFEQLLEIGEERLGKPIDRWKFLHYLGFDIWCSQSSPEERKEYVEIAESIIKEQITLVSESKALFITAKIERKQIHSLLEDFLKSNNLRLEPEPH